MASAMILGQSKPSPISVMVAGQRIPVELSSVLERTIASFGLSVEKIADTIQKHQANMGVARPKKQFPRTGRTRGRHQPRERKQSVIIAAASGDSFVAKYTISLFSTPFRSTGENGNSATGLKARLFILELLPTASGKKFAPPAAFVEQYKLRQFIAIRRTKKAEHQMYLDVVTAMGENSVPIAVARRGLQLWQKCGFTDQEGSMVQAVAGATESGHLIYTWDGKGIHLEAELTDGLPTEWYYQNDVKKDIWYENTDEMPVRAAEAIREIAKASTR